MPLLLQYLLKLSISLAVVFLFYHCILRKLTFYNHNRWYLLGYSLLSFFIPLVNISPALEQNELTGSKVIQWIPQVYASAAGTPAKGGPDYWNLAILLISTGMILFFVRLLLQLWSFRRMRSKATLIASQEVNIYQVDGKVIPFSFGNAVFINPALHTPSELEEIIRHEFVHVKQRHSLDILFSEILCLLNWYNPFAWLIRSAIRQNLEFIADNKVLEKGANKKQYQYLLLKVIGNSQFSIAPKFNFSSLKKRIAMMNKLQSSKKHLLRFLFLLPVLAFILVSFRKEIGDRLSGRQQPGMPRVSTDTIPHPSTLNDKGYQITIRDNKGNCTLVIRDQSGKEVKQMLLTDWNKDSDKYEARFGQIPPAPPPIPTAPVAPDHSLMKDFLKRNPTIKEAGWVYNGDNSVAILHLNMKDGTTQQYDLRSESERKAAEARYGELPLLLFSEVVIEDIPAPYAVMPDQRALEVAGAPAPPATPAVIELPGHVRSISINNGKATVTHKDGKKEEYDLNKAQEKKEFEKKYGAPPATPVPPAAPGNPGTKLQGSFKYEKNKVFVTKPDGKKEVYDLSDPVQKTEFLTIYDKPAITGIQEVPVTGYPVKSTVPLQTITVEGKPVQSSAKPVTNLTIADVPLKTVKLADPVLASTAVENIKLAEVRTTAPLSEIRLEEKPKPANNQAVLNRVDVVLDKEQSVTRTLEIAGLGLRNEGQYIELDGKEYKPNPADKLKGKYRISFLDKKQAVLKFGEKGKNGAIIVETQR